MAESPLTQHFFRKTVVKPVLSTYLHGTLVYTPLAPGHSALPVVAGLITVTVVNAFQPIHPAAVQRRLPFSGMPCCPLASRV